MLIAATGNTSNGEIIVATFATLVVPFNTYDRYLLAINSSNYASSNNLKRQIATWQQLNQITSYLLPQKLYLKNLARRPISKGYSIVSQTIFLTSFLYAFYRDVSEQLILNVPLSSPASISFFLPLTVMIIKQCLAFKMRRKGLEAKTSQTSIFSTNYELSCIAVSPNTGNDELENILASYRIFILRNQVIFQYFFNKYFFWIVLMQGYEWQMKVLRSSNRQAS